MSSDFWEADDPVPFAENGVMIPPAFGWRCFFLLFLLMAGYIFWSDDGFTGFDLDAPIDPVTAQVTLGIVGGVLYLSYVMIRNLPTMIINKDGIRLKRAFLPDYFLPWFETGPFTLVKRRRYLSATVYWTKYDACAFSRKHHDLNTVYNLGYEPSLYLADFKIRLAPLAYCVDGEYSEMLVHKLNQLREHYGGTEISVVTPIDESMDYEQFKKLIENKNFRISMKGYATLIFFLLVFVLWFVEAANLHW